VVREYRPSDLSAVVTLFQRTVREVNARDYSPFQISAWAPDPPDLDAWSKRLSSGAVFVAERHGDIVGFIRIEANGNLDLLYVAAEFQRQGVAKALFDQVLSWASSRGIKRFVSEVSVTAKPFFERVGFRVLRSQVIERHGISIDKFRHGARAMTPNPRFERTGQQRCCWLPSALRATAAAQPDRSASCSA
jgi:putative acetyltransferase